MLRLILVLFFAVAYLILTIPVLAVEWLIGKFNPHVKDITSLRMVQWIFKVILWGAGVKLDVIGEDKVPKDQAVLYIGNHRSNFDPIITYSRCPGLTGYVAKKEMKKIPLLCTWMKYLHCHFLDRKDLRQGLKMILSCIEDINNGISICIFPEGTRSKQETETPLLPFHEGSFKIAQKTNCPIIPMALTGTNRILETQFPKIKSTHVILEYGKPIIPSELSPEERKHLGGYTGKVIEEMLEKNRSLL